MAFFRTTRSGHAFSPYAGDYEVRPIRVPVDYGPLLDQAILDEMEASLEDNADVDNLGHQPEVDATTESRKHLRPTAPSQPPSRNAHWHKKRGARHDTIITENRHEVSAGIAANILEHVAHIETTFSANAFSAAQNAYTARRGKIHDAGRHVTPAGLDEMGFILIKYEPNVIRPVVNACDRVIACFANKPNDPKYSEAYMDAFDEMMAEGGAAKLKATTYMRGEHPAFNTGLLMGLGQPEPMMLKLSSGKAMIHRLVGHRNIQRMAAFASASFKLWALHLHAHYCEGCEQVTEQRPAVHKNFKKSIFPTACFNFGGNVITYKHRDTLNIPYGWCPVTALGPFNHRLSTHIILWDLKLYFEFPHTCMMFIPSASCVHSNTPLANPLTEHRLSFTQYFLGTLLRWLDNGYMTDRELKLRDPEAFQDLAKVKALRCGKGLGMFSTLTEVMDHLNSIAIS